MRCYSEHFFSIQFSNKSKILLNFFLNFFSLIQFLFSPNLRKVDLIFAVVIIDFFSFFPELILILDCTALDTKFLPGTIKSYSAKKEKKKKTGKGKRQTKTSDL